MDAVKQFDEKIYKFAEILRKQNLVVAAYPVKYIDQAREFAKAEGHKFNDVVVKPTGLVYRLPDVDNVRKFQFSVLKKIGEPDATMIERCDLLDMIAVAARDVGLFCALFGDEPGRFTMFDTFHDGIEYTARNKPGVAKVEVQFVRK